MKESAKVVLEVAVELFLKRDSLVENMLAFLGTDDSELLPAAHAHFFDEEGRLTRIACIGSDEDLEKTFNVISVFPSSFGPAFGNLALEGKPFSGEFPMTPGKLKAWYSSVNLVREKSVYEIVGTFVFICENLSLCRHMAERLAMQTAGNLHDNLC